MSARRRRWRSNPRALPTSDIVFVPNAKRMTHKFSGGTIYSHGTCTLWDKKSKTVLANLIFTTNHWPPEAQIEQSVAVKGFGPLLYDLTAFWLMDTFEYRLVNTPGQQTAEALSMWMRNAKQIGGGRFVWETSRSSFNQSYGVEPESLYAQIKVPEAKIMALYRQAGAEGTR